MNNPFKQIGLSLLLLVALSLGSCSQKYKYETVPNDPLKARIYTLDNGLKVYMTVNKSSRTLSASLTSVSNVTLMKCSGSSRINGSLMIFMFIFPPCGGRSGAALPPACPSVSCFHIPHTP